MTAGAWGVVVRNDEVNTFEGVTYTLWRLTGLPVEDCWSRALFVHERGSAEVGRFADQHEAELLAARLQVFGLHAEVAHD